MYPKELLTIALAAFALIAAAPVEAAGCLVITGKDWQSKLDAAMGERVCIRGRLFANAHGSQFVVDPPWGNPPYGTLVFTDLTQREAYLAEIGTGKVTSLRGHLVGERFCAANPNHVRCENWSIRNFPYYLLVEKIPAPAR